MTTVSNWDATTFFERLTDTNILARNKKFRFCKVSGLQGFEDALASMQTTTAFVCVSDTADLPALEESRRSFSPCVTNWETWQPVLIASIPCGNCSGNTCRCSSWSRPSFRNAPYISIRASASPRYPSTSLRAAPALRSKSLSISIPICVTINPNGCRKQHSRSFLPMNRQKHRQKNPINLKP